MFTGHVTPPDGSPWSHSLVVGLSLLVVGLLAVLIIVLIEPAKGRLRIALPWDPILAPLVRFKPRALPLVAAGVWAVVSFALVAPFVFTEECTGSMLLVLPFLTFCIAVPAALASYLWCMASFARLLGVRHMRTLLVHRNAAQAPIRRFRHYAPSLLLIVVAAVLAASITYLDDRPLTAPWVMVSMTRFANSFLGFSLFASMIWMVWRVMLCCEPRDRRRLAYGPLFLRSDRLKRFYTSITAMMLSTTCVLTPYATAALWPEAAGAMLMPKPARVLWTGLVLLMAVGGVLLIARLEVQFAASLRKHARVGTIAGVARRLEIRDRMLGGHFMVTLRVILAGALGAALQVLNLVGAVTQEKAKAAGSSATSTVEKAAEKATEGR